MGKEPTSALNWEILRGHYHAKRMLEIATSITQVYLEVPRDNAPLDQLLTYARLRCLSTAQRAEEALKYLAFVLKELSPDEKRDKRTLCPDQQTSLAHYMCYVVLTDQNDLDDTHKVSRFTCGLFTMYWTSLFSSDGHTVSQEFDLFYQENKLDAHEQMLGSILNESCIHRIAARIAPSQSPDAIIGTVS